MSAVALNDVWKKQCICPICHHLSESDMQQAGDDKLTRSDKIHHMDKKLNDPSPGVPSSHEARGEVRGGAKMPRKTETNGWWDPGSEGHLRTRCSPQVLHLFYTVFKMTDVNGWTVGALPHSSLCRFANHSVCQPDISMSGRWRNQKKKINPRDKRDVHESIMKTAEGVKKMK